MPEIVHIDDVSYSEILENMSPEEIDVHEVCGSPLLEERRWVNINTGETFGNDESGETYCNECERLIGSEEITSQAKYDEK